MKEYMWLARQKVRMHLGLLAQTSVRNLVFSKIEVT